MFKSVKADSTSTHNIRSDMASHNSALLRVQAPRQLLALIAAAAQLLATNTAPTPAAAAAAAPPCTSLQACRTRLVLLSQLSASQLQQQLSADVAGAALSADSAAAAAAATAAAAAAAAEAAGFSSIKSIAVPPLRARASDIAPMALQAALPEAVLRGYTAVELTDAAELQLAGMPRLFITPKGFWCLL
jgi:hypothetical protein